MLLPVRDLEERRLHKCCLTRMRPTGTFPCMGNLDHPLLANNERLAGVISDGDFVRHGARGDFVVRLQLALISSGEAMPGSTKSQSQIPDGDFGNETLAAVRGFQSKQELSVDGIVGSQTLLSPRSTT